MCGVEPMGAVGAYCKRLSARLFAQNSLATRTIMAWHTPYWAFPKAYALFDRTYVAHTVVQRIYVGFGGVYVQLDDTYDAYTA